MGIRHPRDFGAIELDNQFRDAGRWENMDKAIKAVTVDGLWAEFGVFEGTSLKYIAAKADGKVVFGFDWFNGLPKEENGWREGLFKTSRDKLGTLPANVVIREGLFAESLPKFKEEVAGQMAFIHVDSDIYSSAATIFTELAERIVKGTVIVFDEYLGSGGEAGSGEALAFEEFLARTERHARFLYYTSMQTTAVMED